MAKFKDSNIILQDDQFLYFNAGTISGTGDTYCGDLYTVGNVDIGGHMAVGNDADIDFPGFPTYEILCNMKEDFDASIVGAYGLQLYARGAADSGSAQVRGIAANAMHTGSGQFSEIRGIYGAAYTNTAGATGTTIRGIYGSAYMGESTTTVTNLIGGYFTAGAVWSMVTATGTNVVAGQFKALATGSGDFSATNVYGIQVVQPGASYNGTLTNLYGLYIEDMTASSMSFANEYNIYSAGATSQNYFEGDINFDGTVSGAGDIYCGDLYTAGTSVHIGSVELAENAGVLTIDSNLDLDGKITVGGGTPKATASFTPSIVEVGESAQSNIAGVAAGLYLTSNAYFAQAGWLYSTSAAASEIYMEDGDISLKTAPIGTADAACGYTERLIVKKDGLVYIGSNVTNPKMTVGLTINQAGNDDEILALKSSDVSHARTSKADANTYASFLKDEAAGGGLKIRSFKDSDGTGYGALSLVGRTYSAWDTTKSSAGRGVIELITYLSAADSDNRTAAGNEVAIRNYDGEGYYTQWLCDSDGKTWQNSSFTVATGACFIGTPTNANNSAGLTIKQSVFDDEILAFKSSDVAHGRTGIAETDTYASFKKEEALAGGLLIQTFKDTDANNYGSFSVMARSAVNIDTTKSTGGRGAIELNIAQTSANADASVVADANLFTIRKYDGESYTTSLIVGRDGETYQWGTAYVGETTNTFMGRGITIQQGTHDDEILALKSADTAHAYSSYAETDTFATFQKYDADKGGLLIRSFAGTSTPKYSMKLEGWSWGGDSTKGASALAPIILQGQHYGGSGNPGAVTGDNNLLVISTYDSSARWLVTGDGSTYQDGGATFGGDVDFGANTISGTGDIYCGDLIVSDSTVLYHAGEPVMATQSTGITVGEEDNTGSGGIITVYGRLNEDGGEIVLHTPANADDTITHYRLRARGDDLQIGPSTDDDALQYTGSTGVWEFTNAAGVNITGDTTLAGSFIITNPFTPTSSSGTGVSGTIAWDSDYLYVCHAANTWKRAALTSW